MRVLVVDDDPSVRDLLVLQLELEGHEVVTAADGARGLAAVDAERPDLVVLDVMMPELDGWEVLTRLRRDPRHTGLPVLLLTARDMPLDRQRAYELGASSVLSKPHDGQRFTDTVTALAAARALS